LSDPHPLSIDLSADEWQTLTDLAIRHGVAPLVHRSTCDFPGVPEWASERLRRQHVAWGWKNGLVLAELVGIFSAAERGGIRLIALKGAALIARVYEDPALRPLGDIDLLLRREDVERLVPILAHVGFTRSESRLPLSFYLRHHFSLPFHKPGRPPIQLDLHWDIVDRFRAERPNLDRLWEGRSEVAVGGGRIATFALGDLLLHAALHFAIHVPYVDALAADPAAALALVRSPNPHARLLWVVDLVALARRVPLEELVEVTRHERLQSAVRPVLGLLNQLAPQAELAAALEQLGAVDRVGAYSSVLRRVLEIPSGRLHRVLHNVMGGTLIRPTRLLVVHRLLIPPRERISQRITLWSAFRRLAYAARQSARLLWLAADVLRFGFARRGQSANTLPGDGSPDQSKE
jgi:hypothetical protein